MKKAIQKAIEGGWKYDDYCDSGCGDRHILLDPFFWKCLGKAMGWNKGWYFGWFVKREHGGSWEWRHADDNSVFWGGYPHEAPNIVFSRESWLYNWHRFIDHLADGGTAKDFFDKLLK